jgi:SAM-dependent methyltransferase
VIKQSRCLPYLEENLWGYGKRLRFVTNAIKRRFPQIDRRELKVLDIGCGNGSQLAIPLAAGGYQVTAVDPHLQSIERGRSLAPDVDFRAGVLSDLPASGYHCVVISEVLEHLDQPEELLSAALPYLADSGVLIVTVPNGYGEFEFDRRAYQTLRVDKIVTRLRALIRGGKSMHGMAGSDDDSPHIQRFTLGRLRRAFARNNLLVLESRGMSLFSGPFVAHLLGGSNSFININAAVADYLPLSVAAGWMFALTPAGVAEPTESSRNAI